MRSRLAVLFAVLLMIPLVAMPMAATAAPGDAYDGPYFGDGNLPPGCIRDMARSNPANECYHMRTGLNALDSPQIDVLVVAPVSPTAERDMRIMRQSIEMWEGGIDYLASQMDLPWLEEGVDFHVMMQAIDPATGEMGEFTTYPAWDPEIVVIATNPVGGIGIGVDPQWFATLIWPSVPAGGEGACHTVDNPLDFDAWDSLPGFDNHHDRSGTYVEDCDGAGGNVCFAVNGAIDPDPNHVDFFQLFDLVSHEVGHCLTLGHVGDGAEGDWGAVPYNDIMAYDEAPHGLAKCVSTLDVETFATRMSAYLDVNGDGTPGDPAPVEDGGDRLTVNDVPGDGRNPFQVQHPRDHRYASSTGSPYDCPQPDVGLFPGEPVDWTPDPVTTSEPRMTVTDSSATSADSYRVAGIVEHVSLTNPPTVGSTTVVDDPDDATTPMSEITQVDVEVTDTDVIGTLHIADLWPEEAQASGVSYSLVVDGRQFDSYLPAQSDAVRTYDTVGRTEVVDGSSWDADADTVTFTLPRAYLAEAGIEAPYDVVSQTNVTYTGAREAWRLLRVAQWIDDRAPNPDTPVVIDAPGAGVATVPTALAQQLTQTRRHEGTYYADESSLGAVELWEQDRYTEELIGVNDVAITLTWEDGTVRSDLDLYVTGAADSGQRGATVSNPETVSFADVTGTLDLHVDPYFVGQPLGLSYTLTLQITCKADCPPDTTDSDGDEVPDSDDACPTNAGTQTDGCPPPSGTVALYVDDALVASQDVATYDGPAAFDLTATGLTGTHTLRVDWVEDGEVIASETLTVESDADGDGVPDSQDVCPGHDDTVDGDGDGVPDGCDAGEPADDRDGDGVGDDVDNCGKAHNPDQADMDDDGEGDACDNDIDGDGHHNKKEEAHGSDPRDPESTPAKGGGA
ncbi:MAG: thrombospondin type 3 repeat-containing protein [Actinobacteria bacterium]|nr:thrombospondin type 3 repeat-containing protein [Actinomycetota bacterium]